VSRSSIVPGRPETSSPRSRRTTTVAGGVAIETPAAEWSSPKAPPLAVRTVPIRIVVADGHPVVREGLIRVITEENGLEVIGHAGDGLRAVELVRQLKPDILMLDHAAPQRAGVEVLRELARTPTNCRVIIMAASLGREQMVEVLRLGAYGIVMKDSPMTLIVKSISTVMAGQYWIGRESVGDLISSLRNWPAPTKSGESAAKPRFALTVRELQIVSAVVAAYSNREIAERFSLSEDTVKHHLSNIFDKLGLSNRLELALFAINHQLVET
jgi:two-component system nitrate/nitrite response regulator NarL